MATVTTVIEFLVFATVVALSYIAVCANPVDNGGCVRALQTKCREEVDLLNQPQSGNKNASCKYLSPAIACIACKVQNCSDLGKALLQQFNFCQPNTTNLILLQGMKEAQVICILMTTSTTTQVATKPPTATTQAHSSGKQTQIQDKQDSGSSSISKTSMWVVMMAGLLLMEAGWR